MRSRKNVYIHFVYLSVYFVKLECEFKFFLSEKKLSFWRIFQKQFFQGYCLEYIVNFLRIETARKRPLSKPDPAPAQKKRKYDPSQNKMKLKIRNKVFQVFLLKWKPINIAAETWRILFMNLFNVYCKIISNFGFYPTNKCYRTLWSLCPKNGDPGAFLFAPNTAFSLGKNG